MSYEFAIPRLALSSFMIPGALIAWQGNNLTPKW